MSTSTIIFYILTAFILGNAFLAVTSQKIFRSAVFLLFSLIGIAGLYFFMNYEFLAAIQIIVYVGGIIVLIIFSIFLTNQSGNEMPRASYLRILFSAFAVILSCFFVIGIVINKKFNPSEHSKIEPTVANIGRQMLSTTEHGYILPFELISILLLAAMIGCIVIAIKIKE